MGTDANYARAIEDVRTILFDLMKKYRERTCFYDHEAHHAEGAFEALDQAQEEGLRLLPAISETTVTTVTTVEDE